MREDSDIQRAEAFLNADDHEHGDKPLDDDARNNADGGTPAETGAGNGNTAGGEEVTPERMAEVTKLGETITEALQTIFDPEIPVNIYDLGLIYKIDVHDDNSTTVEMTLTSPHCPVAEILPGEVEQKVKSVDGVNDCEVKIVWDPPWHPQMMSEEAQLELGMIY